MVVAAEEHAVVWIPVRVPLPHHPEPLLSKVVEHMGSAAFAAFATALVADLVADPP